MPIKSSAILKLTSPLHTGSEQARIAPADLPQGASTNYVPLRRLGTTMMIAGKETISMLPAVSGNSIRHKLREILVDITLSALDLDKEALKKNVLEMFVSGGGMDAADAKKNDKDEENVGKGKYPILVRDRQTLRAAIPQISLFGCSYGNRMLKGLVEVGWALPALQETKHITGYDSPIHYNKDLTSFQLGTRHDTLTDRLEEGEKSKQSIYYTEVLATGVPLYHEIHLDEYSTPIERSALQLAIELFLENGTLGGKSSSGYGFFNVEKNYEPFSKDSSLYIKWLNKNKDVIRDYILAWDKPELIVKREGNKDSIQFPETTDEGLTRLVNEQKEYINAVLKQKVEMKINA